MQKLLIATHNSGKLAEFSDFLSDLPLEILSLDDMGIDEDIEEDGKTYEENSQKKAIFYAKKSGLPSLSDDGGIEISALSNEPGVRSRRWLGHESTDDELIEHMKKISKHLPKDNRKAFFRTVVTLALPNGKISSVTGEIEGEIAEKPLLKVLKGYPYRSFFFLPKIRKYYHESDLSKEEQKLYNHRYIAVNKLKPIIERELNL